MLSQISNRILKKLQASTHKTIFLRGVYMREVYERLDNLDYILSEIYARAGFNSVHEDLRCYSWEQLCQNAKDILQWLKIYGNG